jgi:D-alanyl-D-alanine carboxypeptidase
MIKKVAGVVLAAAIITGGIWFFGYRDNQNTQAVPHASQNSTDNPAPQAKAEFDKKQYSPTKPSSPWVIVNKSHPLSPIDYAPADLTTVGYGQYMAAPAAQALEAMLDGAKAAGYTVTPASGYRSYQTQVHVYANEVNSFGQAVADTESARPGYSEHQTGLAMDLASGGCSITDCFADTPGGKWVTANAYKYGFILRYPADKVEITGYRYESWHFRYVGVGLATQLHKDNVETLEEFFGVSGGTSY